MYADDTTLASTLENFGTVNDVTNLERELNQEITKVYSWLLSNKLMLNEAKSKFMIFFKVQKVVPRLSLTIAGNPIEQVPMIKISLGSLISQRWQSKLRGSLVY